MRGVLRRRLKLKNRGFIMSVAFARPKLSETEQLAKFMGFLKLRHQIDRLLWSKGLKHISVLPEPMKTTPEMGIWIGDRQIFVQGGHLRDSTGRFVENNQLPKKMGLVNELNVAPAQGALFNLPAVRKRISKARKGK